MKSNSPEYTDNELISRYKESGNKDFIGILFKRYIYLVIGVCMKYLKDEEKSRDASMQVFEKLFEDLKKHEVEYFKSWLYSVAKNHCLMQLRAEKVQKTRDFELKIEYSRVMENGLEGHLNSVPEQEQKLNRLEEGIQALPEEQRICVELFYLKEKCYQEVAQITGYTLNQVKSYIQNGKRNLKLYLVNET